MRTEQDGPLGGPEDREGNPVTLRRVGTPDLGHRFKITVTSSMSAGIAGIPGHTDADWWGEPITMTVRAWDLATALSIAAQGSLGEWRPDDGSQAGDTKPSPESIDLLVKFDDDGTPGRVLIYDTLKPSDEWGEEQFSVTEAIREVRRRVRARGRRRG